jgi:hypothetical protein
VRAYKPVSDFLHSGERLVGPVETPTTANTANDTTDRQLFRGATKDCRKAPGKPEIEVSGAEPQTVIEAIGNATEIRRDADQRSTKLNV